MNNDPLMNALDNALDNIKIGNHEATGVSLDVAEKYMRNKDPVAFAKAEKEFNTLFPPSNV